MIEIIKELNIEVSKPNVFQAIVAKQYDMNTRFIKATFVDGGEKITIDPNATVSVVINALRPDGESKGFDGVVNEDGTVTVPLHSWMLELVGTVTCDISVIDTESEDNKKLTTTSFTLLVEKAAYGGDDITSDPQYDVLVTLVETCNEASTVAQEALEKSNTALEKSTLADSKYAACVEATENANAVREEIEAGGYIESLKELNNGYKFSFWVGTQAEYDALTETVNNCFYIITDDKTQEEINQSIADAVERIANLENKEQVLFTADDTDPIYNDTTGIVIQNLHEYSIVKILGGAGGTTACLCSVESYEDDDTSNFVVLRGTSNDGLYCDESYSSINFVSVQLSFQFNGQTSTLSQVRSYRIGFVGGVEGFTYSEFPISQIIGIV